MLAGAPPFGTPVAANPGTTRFAPPVRPHPEEKFTTTTLPLAIMAGRKARITP
jgi:hypothetical protein